MTIRISKILLVAALALFYTFVVINNLADFNTNYQFVRHVLSMDTTFPGNHSHWRSIDSPVLQVAFYWSIIGWEAASAFLLWWSSLRMVRARSFTAPAFERAKRLSIMALTVSLLLWVVAFLTVGGEWFLMWQSTAWNGQQEAFRMFAVEGIVFLIVLQAESDLAR